MYESHWGLHRLPFLAKVDSDSYYPSESHQAAALKLHYALEQRRSVAVICGEPGLGKTMLLESCLDQLPEHIAPVTKVVYPAMPPDQLLRFVVRQMGPVESKSNLDLSQAIETLERFLRHNLAEGNHAVVAIDEAHMLEQYGSLEPLRLILNLAGDACDTESPLTLVLAGGTTLLSHVAKHSSLEDRVAVRCHLERFSLDDTVAYVLHRLRCSGCNREDIFSAKAFEHLHLLSQGIPRRINRLCDLALMIGFAQELKTVDARTILSAHAELSSQRLAA
ncbi:MAG: AAA family ATPase [Pirellula sp.]|jgi:general secretion pathway protein A|nr:AAA family ATPase [Pirellula sp.]